MTWVDCHLDKNAVRRWKCTLWSPHTNIVLSHTHAQFSKAVEWDNGQGDRIVGRFYHSHSLNHQPSVKCTHSHLGVCGCVYENVYLHKNMHIWMDLSNSLKAWMNIHHVNQADTVNSSAQSHSNRIVYLGSQLLINRQIKQVKHMVGTNQPKHWSHWKVKWNKFIVLS